MPDPHPNLVRLNATRNRAAKPLHSLCYAPFTQLSFDPTGAVSVCCLSRFAPLGSVAESTLEELWTGASMQAFRAALQRDEWPQGCKVCRWELESGNVHKHPLRDFDDVPIAVGGRWPTRLEFALTNQCNLACVHCRAELSSTIARREGRSPMPVVYGERFFAELADFLPHATNLSFLGGEPFLQDECHRIWEMLVERGLRPAVFVTTNGTVWNRRVESILERLPMHIAVSLDAVQPKTMQAIRVLAQPANVMRNVHRFRDYALRRHGGVVPSDGHLISLNFCLMRRNWREMGDFFLMAEELACRIWATPIVWPPARGLFSLPARAQRAVADALQRRSATVLPQLRRNAASWTGVLAVVEAEAQKAARREATQAAAARSPMIGAWAAMARGAEEEAYHAAAKTLPEDPNFLASLLLRASLLTPHGHLELAEQMVDEAARLAPDAAELLLRRAWLRWRQGRLQEGLADAARLAQQLLGQPDAPAWLVHGSLSVQANLCKAVGDHQGALAAIDRLLVLAPQNTAARAFRAQLLAP